MNRKLLFSFILTMLLAATQVFAQDRTISGRITDENGEPVPGATIVLKGNTAVATVADENGRYSISVPAGSVLIFSFLGQTQEAEVGNRTTMDVTLGTRELKEVVVTALGIEKETKNLGYSVTQLGNKDLTIGRPTNIVNSLQGKVAGVRVIAGNGMVGASSQIFIRGFTSLQGSNQPLFVIDGVPIDNSGGGNTLQTGVNNSNRAIDLNQDDIESMTILKGPSAAALYGSRASAGAILITTKKGKRSQKNTVTITSMYNVGEVNRFPDYQNEYAQGSGGVFTQAPGPGGSLGNFSWGPRMEGQTVTNFLTQADADLLGVSRESVLRPRPDNVRSMFNRTTNRQNTVSFSGGTDKSSFFFSYGNTYETGYFANNKLDRNNFTANVSSKLSNKLDLSVGAQYVNTTSVRTPQGNQLANPLFRLWMTPRSFDYRDIPFIRPTDFSQVHWDAVDHPLFAINEIRYNDKVNRFIGNVGLNYQVNDWLSINHRVGADIYDEIYQAYDAPSIRGAGFWNNTAARTNLPGQSGQAGRLGAIGGGTQTYRQISSFLNILAKKDINDDFTISGLLGNEINIQERDIRTAFGNSIAVPRFNNISNTLSFQASQSLLRSRLAGFYGQVEVAYRGWAVLGLTGRYDLSSTFPTNNQGYFYPAVTGTLIMSEAIPALKNNVIEFLKLRANYTQVGRPSPFLYATDTYFAQANPADGFGPQIQFPFRGRTGFTLQNTAGNPNLGPEFVSNYEVGTEMRFFKNKLRFDLNYFKSVTTDAILSVPQSAASGFTASVLNAGQLSSSGWELLVGTNFNIGEVKFDVSVNWSRIRNMVDKLADGVEQVTLAGFVRPNTQLAAGQPYGVFFGSVFERDEATGKLLVDNNGLPIVAPENGFLGDPNPDWTGGINTAISWKGLSLSLIFDIRKGGDGFFRTLQDMYRTGVLAETASRPRFNANGTLARNWIIDGIRQSDGAPNDVALTAEQYWESLYRFGRDEFAVREINWFRLREASVSYTLPKKWLEKTPVGNVEVGVNGRNLLLFTNVPHIDPEISGNFGVGNAIGFESNNPPPVRSYGFFVKASF